MNAIDYFFENTKDLSKLFILNTTEQITFQELYNETNRIASFLKTNFGVQKNILLCAGNGKFFVSTYLGIIKSGNVCVPVNPASSSSTLDFIINETKPVCGFIQKRYSSMFNEKDLNIYSEEDLIKGIESYDYTAVNQLNDPDSDNLAEIIYTSGSTSFPKGVMITHKNLIANTSSIIEYLKLSERDIVLDILPFHYCYGLSLLHTHLRAGGSIAINTNFMLIGGVLNDLKKYKCTGFAGVPSHFQVLLRKSDSFKNTKFEHLRYVTQAGGKLHKVFIEEFINSFPNVQFFVMYGQTEATARLSYLPPERLLEKLGSIGVGIPGVELKLIDSEGNEIQDGEEGEIIARGDNVMKGYFNDPELTSATLMNGFLRTGDIAYRDNDGFFYLVARKKEIIKVGGERVSPKEIESVIVNIPQVIDCTIEGLDDEILGEKIKATIVINQDIDKKEMEQKILNECKSKLSSIKIPQIIEFKENINVSSSGKKTKNA